MSLKAQLERQVRFFHPQQKYGFLRGGFDVKAHAALFGLRESFYRAMLQSFADQVHEAALTLVEDEQFCQWILQLPLTTGSQVVALGDSLTDDSLSWFAILAAAFALIRPKEQVEWRNLAVSGDTTAQLLGSVISAVQLKADLYICFSGTNDGRIQGGRGYKPCTSIAEVAANLTSVMAYAKDHTSVPWVWITPVGVDSDRIGQHDFFKPLAANWCNEHIAQVADLVVKQAPLVIDIRPIFQINDLATDPCPIVSEPAATLLDEDGLHWSLAGHTKVAKEITGQLVELLLR